MGQCWQIWKIHAHKAEDLLSALYCRWASYTLLRVYTQYPPTPLAYPPMIISRRSWLDFILIIPQAPIASLGNLGLKLPNGSQILHNICNWLVWDVWTEDKNCTSVLSEEFVAIWTVGYYRALIVNHSDTQIEREQNYCTIILFCSHTQTHLIQIIARIICFRLGRCHY